MSAENAIRRIEGVLNRNLDTRAYDMETSLNARADGEFSKARVLDEIVNTYTVKIVLLQWVLEVLDEEGVSEANLV
jgi:hypothetical protein